MKKKVYRRAYPEKLREIARKLYESNTAKDTVRILKDRGDFKEHTGRLNAMLLYSMMRSGPGGVSAVKSAGEASPVKKRKYAKARKVTQPVRTPVLSKTVTVRLPGGVVLELLPGQTITLGESTIRLS